ncbi:autotransporter outer membrane beta-barrel domain-containing protein [Phaeobacter marinintestinus]|uniref:autotransporter outer membrane beta-barrel domain-containing protein n=1 Tax=Falsiphaeobacter marinintestinus TaxID=1492905 RepID=UPI0016492D7A|nr:autotransporter outer membrane beta-barrel domain-containing protein [Phaeobacter marinintestinus]
MTCTVTDADGVSNISVSDTTTSSQATYTINNDAALTPNSDLSYGNYGILLDVYGDDGTGSNPDGIAGGNLTVDNSGSITMTGTTAQDASQGEATGIRVWSQGGDGTEPDKNGTDGGRGGDGGQVTVTNSGVINIESSATIDLDVGVYGINARSYAGNGGDQSGGVGDEKGGSSGDAKQMTITNSGAISLGSSDSAIRGANVGRAINVQGIGKTGGDDNGNGGSGSTIDLTNTGDLSVYYDEVSSGSYGVHGIFAKSEGGAGTKSYDNSDNGGKGEEGRVVTVTNNADITIVQTGSSEPGESAGIKALSIGGQGGESSDKASGGVGGGASVNTDGNAGVLTVNMQGGTISTSGEGISGIVARSEGGVGGNGNGDSRSSGGNGGYGGQIQVDFTGTSRIETQNDTAYGILAQSVGGIGGSNAGSAGTGGNAGAVGVYATEGTQITTQGDYAIGMTFHSIGGGGGTGEDFTGVLSGSGGNGGNGGNANTATLTTGAQITTSGDHAYGLLGQSIGGSGGTGGIGAGLTLELGGDGGGGGAGGVVSINNTGEIDTTGDYAVGILAQSLSGGGGAAGTADGVLAVGGTAGSGSNNTASSYVTNSGDITTTGASSIGITMQSIGGGGGTGGGADGIFTIGGSGSTGGNGGTAQVFAVGGDIQTAGDHAYGIVSQSIGGGGGNGGDVIDVSAGVGVGVGGSGSGGGNGGVACIANTYDGCPTEPTDTGSIAPQQASSGIATTGDFAHGAVVQSIGGGGGNGGDVQSGGAVEVVSIQIGGSAGGGGNGSTALAAFDSLTLSTTGGNAKGIVAQSIGGGGGNGGNSTALDGEVPVSIVVGGTAGGGLNGGSSTVQLTDSTITTSGASAGAILVQSIGGGGGTGGAASGYDAAIGFTEVIAIGGGAGSGGNAEAATATLSGTAVQTGYDTTGLALGASASSSHGISVQSIGGGGGTGGSSTADAMTLAVPTGEGESVAVSGSFAIGGSSGTGGYGGASEVELSNGSTVATGGDGAHGILAQSVGGGGGDGGSGDAFSGSIGVPNTVSADISASLGRAGGSGGAGSTVTVSVDGTSSVSTAGANANGIVAQSIGGGGGDGGTGNATNDKIGRGLNVSADVGLGGKGGSGGTGSTVEVDLAKDSVISTTGSGARGVVAQSIGGGGGTGQGSTIGLKASGFTLAEALNIQKKEGADPNNVLKFNASGSVTLNLGATAGDGNTGGAVNLTTGGFINTTGNDADGVVAQSIGGGGGLGGSAGNESANESGPSLPRYALAVDATIGISASIGGSGGTGGNASAVDLTHAGKITTLGDFSDGILAQSIGGGGGAGGTATAGDGNQTVAINYAIGGSGGAGGNGGAVDVFFNDATGIGTAISTGGTAAHGAMLQSIGGGGGQGATATAAGAKGVSIGAGGLISIGLSGGISVGGGYGGSGGSAGNGGNVTVDDASYVDITTTGDDAYALMAQSIGGGGGYGGVGAAAETDTVIDVDLDLDLEVTVGGTGGSAGNGGTVDISTGGLFSTSGDRAFGIVAQSIGGGGGIAGTTDSSSIASVEFNADDGAGGDGGSVSVELSSGSLTTHGNGSHAIIAQSIGGGGGIAGDLSGPTLDTTYPGYETTNGSGSGEAVDVTVSANITTHGDAAYGVIAQSIGGGGGLSGNDGVLYAGTAGGTNGNGGTVTVTQSNTLTVNGENSIGIFGQSVGVESDQKVEINVNGAVTGGTDEGAGVFVSFGDENVLNISETGSVSAGGSTDDGTRGYAVRYNSDFSGTYGSYLTVNNSGTLNGDVLFVNEDGSTGGTVNNQAGGTWNVDATVGADVVNAGDIVVSGAVPTTSALSARMQLAAAGSDNVVRFLGDFSQSSTGALVFASDFSNGMTNRVEIAGDAELSGSIRIDPVTLAPRRKLTLLSVTGNLSGEVDVEDTPTVDYDLTFVGNQASVSVNKTRFGTAFGSMNSNQRQVGRHLDEIFELGAANFETFLADFSSLSATENGEASYSAGLTSLAPGGAEAAAAAQTTLAQTRMDGALFCQGRTRSTFRNGEDDCAWFDIRGTDFNQDGLGGYSGDQYVINAGARTNLPSDWTIGVAVGYERSSYDANDGLSTADGDTGYLAAAAGKAFGNFALSGAVTASYGDYDLKRTVNIPSYVSTAQGRTHIETYGARIRGSYTFENPWGYIRPAVDLDLVRTMASGYTETGAGIFNLQVYDQSQTTATITPSVEFGRDVTLANSMQMLMFMNVGVSLSDADSWTTHSRLDLAPVGAGQFSTTVPMADQLGRIALGVSLSRSETFEARIEYNGAFGGGFDSHALAFGLTTRF